MARLAGPKARLFAGLNAADSSNLPRPRFLPKNNDWDTVECEIVLGSGVSACTFTPVYVPNDGVIDGTEAQFADTANNSPNFTAPGSYLWAFPARPGYRVGVKIASVTGGSVTTLDARYAKQH